MDGWRVPGFTELRELGAGMQGRVVLARDDSSGDVVAIKYLAAGLLTDPAHVALFRGEANTLHRVTNPHVATLHQYVESAEGAAIVMEAVNGVSLKQVLAEQGALEPEASLVVLKGSLLGLAAAHDVGVVHRDYKPANVIVKDDGTSKLIDFGIAVLAGQGSYGGTPAYMAPEQWHGGAASPATDVYAATCVFFECVTGSKPYRGTDTKTLMGQHVAAPIPMDDAPPAVRPLIAHGMAKDPARRPRSADEFVTELEAAATQAYGSGWENRGWAALRAAAAALAAVFPLAAVGTTLGHGVIHVAGQTGIKGLLGKVTGTKAGAGVAGTAAVAALAYFLWPSGPGIQRAWETDGLVPASDVEAVQGGFALYALNQSRQLEVVGLDGRTGRVRWRHPATPSYVVSGVGMGLAAKDRTAVFIGPTGDRSSGTAEVVAIDAVTGQRRWSFSEPGLRISSQPELCGNQRVCFITTREDFSHALSQRRVLDVNSGRALASTTITDARGIAEDLFPDRRATQLRRVTTDGRTLWRRPIRQIFRSDVSPDAGWSIQLSGSRYVGFLGDPTARSRDRKIYRLDRRGSVAGFDAATGRGLWARPGTSVFCGVLRFDVRHPVLCRASGRMVSSGKPGDKARPEGLDVTLEGFDPATGRPRWSWDAGAVTGLVTQDSSVLRLSDTTFLVRAPSGLKLLDLDSGPRPVSGPPPRGWCWEHDTVKPTPVISDFGEAGYSVQQIWPCNPAGRPARLPITTPEFAGASSGSVFAWSDRNHVKAVTVE